MPECLQGLAAIIARIMIGSQMCMQFGINLDAVIFQVFKEQIKDGVNFELFQNFRKPFLQPGPGRVVGMASFG